MSFHVNGTEYIFKGTLTLVPGDNLASQYLGGFKALASALRKCRQCMAVDDDMQREVCVCACIYIFMIEGSECDIHVYNYIFASVYT